MSRVFFVFALFVVLLSLVFFSAAAAAERREDGKLLISLAVGERIFAGELFDSDAGRALYRLLPLSMPMREHNGNEKYFNLPDSLPVNSEAVGRIQAGDIMLFGSDCVVLFYKGFTSGYSYTRLGRLDDAQGLAAALGSGQVRVVMSVRPADLPSRP